MIKGKLYRVKLGGYVLNVAVPDHSGDRLIEFARLALVEHHGDWSQAEDHAANAAFSSSELIDDIYIDARVVADVHH